jgi:chemotaxis protein methyltransferase CheR
MHLDSAALVEGEFVLTADDFHTLTGWLREQTGIHLPEHKAALVYSRLIKRLHELKLRSFSDYCALLASPSGDAEGVAMVSALTTNVTRFFREPHHFQHLREHVIEPRAASVRAGERMRFWSSACATGEEAYSIALTLLAALPDATRRDVKILATDVDPVALESAKSGVFAEEMVSALPRPTREKWLTRHTHGAWRVRDEVKSLIVFKQLNLIGNWPMRGAFHAIFCRNVVIYFEVETQARLWRRFRDYLAPGGRLYVGHAERVDAPGYLNDGVTSYRLAAS